MQQGLTIYKSSAGSGKTYTLVKEYLKLVLQHPGNYRHILAITFTNKATEEMKERIITALTELADVKNPVLEKQLLEELAEENRKNTEKVLQKNEKHEVIQKNLSESQCPPCLHDSEAQPINIQDSAQCVLDNILHDYSGFSICTIDSFFHSVISAFAREMHLPLRFDVELNQDNVIDVITDELFLEMGKNARLTGWMERLLLFKLDNDKGWKIENDIKLIAKELFKENAPAGNEGENDIDVFTATLQKIISVFEKTMHDLGKKSLALIADYGLQITDFAYGKSGVIGYLEKITKKISTDDYAPTQRTLDAAAEPAKWFTAKSPQKSFIVTPAGENLQNILKEVIAYWDENRKQYASAKAVSKLFCVYGIFKCLQKQLKYYRDEKNAVFISDIPRLLQNFISGNDTSYLFEKTGNKYYYFLIDEFQDTSTLQWKNLFPLVQNSLGSGNFSMVVGDVKQSIYRWRDGNMQLLQHTLSEDLSHFSEIITEKSLNTNYRSKKNIVDFNNEFFPLAASLIENNNPEIFTTGKTSIFQPYLPEDVKQSVPPKNNEGGYIRIEFLNENTTPCNEENDSTKSEVQPETKNNKSLITTGWKALAIEKLLPVLEQLKEDHFSYRDIAILVRKNTEGNTIAKFLFEHGYTQVISPDSLLLNGSPKIVFLLNVLTYLNNQRDDIAKTQILYFYNELQNQLLKQENFHTLFTGHRQTGKKLFEKLLPERFTGHLAFLSKLPLYELVENLIQIFGLHVMADAYIQHFQDTVLEYTKQNQPDIKSFLNWWTEHKDKLSITMPENSNAITIMSIHKAKGLQFPVVIMPFAEWKLLPDSRDILWVASPESPFNSFHALPVNSSISLKETFFSNAYRKEVEQSYIDNLNLLYVAFTRPEQRLYVFCKSDGNQDEIKTTSQLLFHAIKNSSWSGLLNNEMLETGRNIQNSNMPQKHEETNETLVHSPLMENRDGQFNIQKQKTAADNSTFKNISTRWESKIKINPKSKYLICNPDENRTRKINRGVLLHEILKTIHTPKDIDNAVQKILFSGLITENEKETLKQQLDELLQREEVKKLFSSRWQIKTEREILLPDGTMLRPDRVLINGNKAVIIDYKTGKAKADDGEQIEKYAKAMEQLGYTIMEKNILYLVSNISNSDIYWQNI